MLSLFQQNKSVPPKPPRAGFGEKIKVRFDCYSRVGNCDSTQKQLPIHIHFILRVS
jgi:hypothetical protein